MRKKALNFLGWNGVFVRLSYAHRLGLCGNAHQFPGFLVRAHQKRALGTSHLSRGNAESLGSPNHLSGMIYAEDYTRWDAANRLCFDPERAYTAAKSPCKGESFPAEQALSNMALWNAVVNAYSTRQDRRDSFMWGHDGFLATFGRFHEVTADKGPMLAEAARMAERSGVMSMEIMFSVYPKDIKSMAETAASAVGKGDFEGAYRQLETADFPPAGSACIRLIESNEKLRCNGNWSAEVSSGGAHRTP